MKERHLTFGTHIGPGVALALLIDSQSPIAEHGNRAVAFMTGGHATGLEEDVSSEEHEFRTSPAAHQLSPDLSDLRWLDDDDNRTFIDSEDDDGINLMVVTPWGIFDAPVEKERPFTTIALYLSREMTEAETALLQERAVAYFVRHGIRDLTFRLLRQTVTIEMTPVAPLVRPPA